jgi:hypothetical protein
LAIALVHGEEPVEDSVALDERGAYERRNEVLVLFPEGAELSDAQVFLVEAPAGEALGLGVVVGDGRMSISTDMVASAGSWSSRKVPRMDWEPTTITSGLPMIWHAVRIACSSWSRLISPPLSECGLPLVLGE